MEQDKRYYAFISYKREDERWAKWLQHKLEHYKLPSNLNGRTDLPREIRPVFRDTAELNPGNLPQQIHDALAASRHLIVVCSPRSATSPWVNREIEAFIAMGKQDRIIPFIVDGRPMADHAGEECYPQAIRDLPREQELLGANVNEMGRDAAAVKTVAQMFGVRFDTLWKRYEREQKRKRALIIAAVALFVLAVLAVAGVILRQNTVISRSRADLQAAYDNLSAANRKTEEERNRAEYERDRAELAEDSIRVQYDIIEQTNDDLRRTNDARAQAQSRAVAEAAKKLIENGNSYLAMKISLDALRISYTPETESSLRKAVSVNDMIINEKREIRGLSINNNGEKMIATSGENTIHLWDIISGKLVKDLSDSNRFYEKNPVGPVLYNPINNTFVAGVDNEIRIWNVDNGNSQVIIEDSAFISSIALSPDKQKIVVSSWDDKVRLYNLKTGHFVKKMAGEANVTSMCYSPDGSSLAACAWNDTSYLWNVKTGNLLYKMVGHTSGVNAISYSPNGKQIATGSDDKTIRIWNSADGKCQKVISAGARVTSLIFSRDGKKIIAGVGNNIGIFDKESSEQLHTFFGHKEFITKIAYCGDDEQIVTSSFDGTIRKWNMNLDGNPKILTGHEGNVYSASFSPNGESLASSSFDRKIFLWNIPQKRIIRSFEGHQGIVTFVTFSPDGKQLVSCGSDQTVRIWDVVSGKCVHILKGHSNLIRHVTFSPSGEHVVSSSIDGTIRVWNVYTGDCMRIIDCHKDCVQYTSFSSDGKLLVTCGGDDFIRIWNTSTWECIREIFSSSSWKGQVVFSPDNKSILSIAVSGEVCLWNVGSGERLFTINDNDPIWRATFSYDGNLIITVSQEGNIRLMNAKDGSILETIGKHNSFVHSIALSKKGVVATAGEDGTIKLWDFPPLEELIKETRERFKDNPLTPEERRKYYLE